MWQWWNHMWQATTPRGPRISPKLSIWPSKDLFDFFTTCIVLGTPVNTDNAHFCDFSNTSTVTKWSKWLFSPLPIAMLDNHNYPMVDIVLMIFMHCIINIMRLKMGGKYIIWFFLKIGKFLFSASQQFFPMMTVSPAENWSTRLSLIALTEIFPNSSNTTITTPLPHQNNPPPPHRIPFLFLRAATMPLLH